MNDGLDIVAASDHALLVRFGDAIDERAGVRVLALYRALSGDPPRGVVDLHPAYASLLVRFDPAVVMPGAVEAAVRAACADAADGGGVTGRLVEVPVRYGGDDGPDLADVARLSGLSPDELVARHAAAPYRVAFLGFAPGFPYLTGLPRELHVPRLASPRTRVPAGSVAIAGAQAGIYPSPSPGGWRLLGRTDLALYTPDDDPPARLAPGDRVRFVPVR